MGVPGGRSPSAERGIDPKLSEGSGERRGAHTVRRTKQPRILAERFAAEAAYPTIAPTSFAAAATGPKRIVLTSVKQFARRRC